MYKLELHCHNREISACSSCAAEDMIRSYRSAGYSGVVSTNHLNSGTFRNQEDWPWEQKARYFFQGIETLQRIAGEGFDVLPACEINLTPQGWPAYIPNDYLVFGITLNWLLAAGDVRKMTIEELSRRVREAGLLIIHAHPFRCGTVMVNPALLDGYEVYNGNPRHQSNNALAEAWARMNGKIMTSGSDFHQPDDPPVGGIETRERVRDNQALLRVLRSGNYTLLREGVAL